jgi:hypothetical protein
MAIERGDNINKPQALTQNDHPYIAWLPSQGVGWLKSGNLSKVIGNFQVLSIFQLTLCDIQGQ